MEKLFVMFCVGMFVVWCLELIFQMLTDLFSRGKREWPLSEVQSLRLMLFGGALGAIMMAFKLGILHF